MSFYQPANATTKLTTPAHSPCHTAVTSTPHGSSCSLSQPRPASSIAPADSFGYQLCVALLAMALTVMVGLLINPAARSILSLWL